MLLGLLVYEMATGKRPFADIYPLTTVVLAIIHDKIKLNVEADHFLQKHVSPPHPPPSCPPPSISLSLCACVCVLVCTG